MNPDTFKRLCQDGGRMVRPINGLDPFALLWALGGLESSFGVHNVPRHEPAYDRGGRYAEADLIRQFGSMAACSWGPWQVMFTNARRVGDFQPLELMNPHVAILATARFLDAELERKQPKEPQHVFDLWNTGSWKDAILPAEWYRERGDKYYREAMAR